MSQLRRNICHFNHVTADSLYLKLLSWISCVDCIITKLIDEVKKWQSKNYIVIVKSQIGQVIFKDNAKLDINGLLISI